MMKALSALLLTLCIHVGTAEAADYPLEITNLRSDLPDHRISRAYPGIEYNVRPAVIGGAYPYAFTLADAPAGMTIDPRTGVIVWPSPKGTGNPTLIVTDSEGTKVTARWPITVTTDGFRFVDADSGKNAAPAGCRADCGTGTLANPWKTLSDVLAAGQRREIVYFRNGRYTLRGASLTKPGPWQRVEVKEQTKPVVWLAYPGERPVLDFEHQEGVHDAPLIRFTGDNVYVDGLETVNSRYIAFQVLSLTGKGAVFRRMKMHSHGPGLDGANAALILTMAEARPVTGAVIQDSEFFDIKYGSSNCAIKIYSQAKLLVEDNYFHDTDNGGEGVLALKADAPRFTVRGNRFSVPGKAIGGNMHTGPQSATHGEILFNHVSAGVYALDLNQDGMATAIHVYRNTFVGRVRVRNTDAADGPFRFSYNVIVSGDKGERGSRVYYEAVSASDRVVHTDNLTGDQGRNMVDASGDLTGPFIKYRGTHGHQVTTGGSTER